MKTDTHTTGDRTGRPLRATRVGGLATGLLAACLMMGMLGTVCRAEGDGLGDRWLQAADALAGATAGAAEAGPVVAPGPEIKLALNVDYTLVSDYVWRGVNFSEYRGEGRERPNHQLNVGAGVETPLGTFGATVWMEWFSGQKQLDPESDNHLQEVDYVLSYSRKIDPLGLEVELGWIAYQFPQLQGDARCTQEVYISLSFDDSKLFGTKEAVLNPYAAYYLDVDDVRGGWMEFGISHDFALAGLGCKDTPVLKDLTVTPSLVLGVDHRYFADSTQLANLLYGLAVGYDISGALGLPAKCGSLTLTGFLNFSQALALREDLHGYSDVLYGGVTVGYEF